MKLEFKEVFFNNMILEDIFRCNIPIIRSTIEKIMFIFNFIKKILLILTPIVKILELTFYTNFHACLQK